MKADKLVDAIEMIDDDYIIEAHEKTQKKLFNIKLPTLLKLASALVVVMIAVTIMPKMFNKASNGGNYDSSTAEYYYDGEMYESTNGYAADYDIKPSESEENRTDKELTANKKLILTSNLDLETQNMDDVLNTLNQNITKYGGYVQKSSIYYRTSGTRTYEATIRIPAEKYNDFLSDTNALGNPVRYNEDVQDITDSYTDIEARLNSLKAQEAKVLEFYKSAQTIEDLMSIESRLSELRYEIEYYEAQIKNYDLLVAYSTMNIIINETKVYTPTSTSFLSRLGNSFVGGFNNFVEGIGDFIIDVVYNIWTILFIAIVGFVGYRIYKKIRNRKLNK